MTPHTGMQDSTKCKRGAQDENTMVGQERCNSNNYIKIPVITFLSHVKLDWDVDANCLVMAGWIKK